MTDRPARRGDLDINAVSDGYVVYDPHADRVHYLNQTAAVVLELCTGDLTEPEIAASLQSAYGLDEPVDQAVADCLQQFRRERLLSA